MRKYFFVLILFISCSSENPNSNLMEMVEEKRKEKVEKKFFNEKFNNFLKTNQGQFPSIKIDSTALIFMKNFMDSVGGFFFYETDTLNLEYIAEKVFQGIDKKGIEITLILDNTDSMLDDKEAVKKVLKKIYENTRESSQILNMVLFGDNNSFVLENKEYSPEWYKGLSEIDTLNDINKLYEKINYTFLSIDKPESLIDAVYKTISQESVKNNSVLIVITDAPGHTEPEKTHNSISDILSYQKSKNLTLHYVGIISNLDE